MSTEQKLGALYGYIVADALALPFRYCERGTFKCGGMVGYGTFNQPQGTYSHNTALMLAAYDSLKVCGGHLYEDDLFLRCRWALERGKYFIDNNVFDFDHELKKVLETGNRSKRDIPVLLGLTLSFWVLGNYYVTNEFHYFTSNLEPYLEGETFKRDLSKMVIRANYPFLLSPYCPETIESSKHTIIAVRYVLDSTTSYSSAVLKAVNLGGDTCTLASLTGALAGLKYGYSGIPIEWLETLRGRNIIDTIIR